MYRNNETKRRKNETLYNTRYKKKPRWNETRKYITIIYNNI